MSKLVSHSQQRFVGNDRHSIHCFSDIIYIFIPLLLFAFFVAWDMELPGLYMDAVNPDYLVVRYLKSHSNHLPCWAEHPLMPSLYHGAQHVLFGLPIYAITGTTIEALRTVHAAFGAGIILCLYFFIKRVTVPIVSAFALIPLACDPSFVMAFRTQSYITLAPTLWLLLSLLLLTGKTTLPRCFFVASGWSIGWAIYGYFIYLFFLPVLAVIAWNKTKAISVYSKSNTSYIVLFALWLFGVMLGLIFYLLGYFYIFLRSGGFAEAINYLTQIQSNLGTFKSTLGIMDRVIFMLTRLWAVLSNSWHQILIFNEIMPERGSIIKILLLFCGLMISLITPSTRRCAKQILALGVSFLLISMIFGSRLNSHHYVWVVPFLYGLGGFGLVALFNQGGLSRILASLVLVGVVTINFFALYNFYNKLEETGGVGLYSDAITTFSQQASATPSGNYYFFPEWGVFMPFAFLTGGKIPYSLDVGDPKLLEALCKNKYVIIVLPGADRRSAMLSYSAKLHGNLGKITIYTQRDGKNGLETAHILADPDKCDEMTTLPEWR